MATFLELYNSFDTDPQKRGKQFERFVAWFLKNEPEWATQVDQVWLWDEWPERWGVDCGVDLVFRHKNGENWAVQAKCYSPGYDITKHDVDKFLSESNRKSIHHRLLIATTDRISGNAKQVCDAQEKPVVRFLLSDFDRAELDYPANFFALSQAKRKARPEPRDHQNDAITAVAQGLQTADRGQLIMACGTGKTYVTLWIKERLNAQRTLALVPSLGLLSQLLREWTFAADTPFEALCVCSDQTVVKGNDEAIHNVADLAFPVTSSADEVKNFLRGAGNRVVFSTYQSSSVIASAQADATVPAFDLVVADEAHRCTGKAGSEFTTILDNALIRGHKRLFATATPRIYSSKITKAAEERGVEVVGMDNAVLFGETLYALPFGKAIEKKLLTDYRVVIIGVDDPTIAQWIANRELVTTGTGIETDSESLAAQIGLLKAIKDYDLKRIISFHSRIARAEAFATDIQTVMAWVGDEHRPSGSLRADFVSGAMPANRRKVKLDQLKALATDERGVLSNARCLSEGVDVPSLDGVAFIDPRSSQVDIIQAVGRAIRLSQDKKAGTIVLPVFIAVGQNSEDTIEASNFKPIWDVLNALKAHDDVLSAELDQIRTELGRKPGKGISSDGLRRITFDLPATVDAGFGNALSAYLVEQVTASWNFWFGLLETFVEREGHAKVPQGYKTADRYLVGNWVGTQRTTRDTISPERKARLEALPGWSWDPFSDMWEEGFRYLKEFTDQEGHAKVPHHYKTADGYRLGQWVSNQRRDGKNGDLSKSRIKRLNEIDFTWDTYESQWEERFSELQAYKNEHGDVNVPDRFDTGLGKWIQNQRTDYKRGALSAKAIQRLSDIGIVWDIPVSEWEEKFKELLAYKNKYGNLDVPQNFMGLGEWVSTQRKNNKRGKLSDEKIGRLNEAGFVWNSYDFQWAERYNELLAYKGVHGDVNVNVSSRYPKGLRSWASTQRQDKWNGKLHADKIRQLNEIGFAWSWDPLSDQWEEGFRYLKEFTDREGHAKVSSDYKTADGYRVGNWVSHQRAAKDTMLPERKKRLESLPGWLWRVK